MNAAGIKKIVFFSTDPGSPKDVKRIDAFRRAGIDTEAFGFFRKEVAQACRIAGVEWHRLGIIKSGGNYAARLKTMFSAMRSVIRAERATGTLFYYSGYDVAAAGFLLGGRNFIFEISDLMHTTLRFPWSVCGGIVARLLIRFSRCTIFTSEGFSRYFFGAGTPPKKVVYVENKVSPEFSEKAEMPLPVRTSGAPLKIGFVGNWGFSATYNFFEVASRRFPKAEFHVWGGTKAAGGNGDLAKLKDRGNVFFHGTYDALRDLDKIYPQIDAVVATYTVGIPNVRYAEPNKLYDAIFFRTPIIVSAGTFLADRVETLGIGFSVNAEIEDEIVRMLEGFSREKLEHVRASMRKIPRKYAVFDPEEFCRKIFAAIET